MLIKNVFYVSIFTKFIKNKLQIELIALKSILFGDYLIHLNLKIKLFLLYF